MARRKQQRERRLRIRSVRRDPPDLRKLSHALIALAMAQSETEARAEHETATHERREAAG
ncbi:MAG: hypothetical protein ABSB96_05180 [Gaiellaceae bacterium]